MSKLLAMALLALVCAPAIAAETSSIEVRFDDLNLARPAGVAALDRRLSQAARSLCSHLEGRSLPEIRAAGKCRTETLAAVQSRRDARIAMARSLQFAGLSAG